MKKISVLILCLLFAVLSPGNIMAQGNAKTEISSVTQKDDLVYFSLTSSKPFIFGNNRYILYIGDKEFMRNEQSYDEGKGQLTFFIPKEEYQQLKEGAGIYLTYGHVNAQEQELEQLAKQSHRCWSLGKFSKSLLK